MSENVGASTSYNPKGFHGLYRNNITFIFMDQNRWLAKSKGKQTVKYKIHIPPP
jgi:hypothetical protein